jgi:3-phosphoshikimate 1-carboxyvinyltransferase
MSDYLIKPASLHGCLYGIPSKSDLHRLLICAALADQPTTLHFSADATLCDDILATIACLQEIGAETKHTEDGIRVIPGPAPSRPLSFFCRESGSTLRFLVPVAAALAEESSFTGSGKLPNRPLGELLKTMHQNGVTYTYEKADAYLPLHLTGKLSAGNFSLPGDISSQYLTGLLFALPLLSGDSNLILTSPLQSSPYLEMTLSRLRLFQIQIEETEHGFHIPGNQKYRSPLHCQVDADWSNAAFWLVAKKLGSQIALRGLNPDSLQGDRVIRDLISDWDNVAVIDLKNIPDLYPALAVLARGTGKAIRFLHTERLRLKESDRLLATERLLSGIAAGTVDSFGDHRIVMAAAIAATLFGPDTGVLIHGAEAVSKSYPDFFTHLKALGGNVSEFQLR